MATSTARRPAFPDTRGTGSHDTSGDVPMTAATQARPRGKDGGILVGDEPYDVWILVAAMGLLGVGVVMVYSASVGVADMRFDDPNRYLRAHLRHIFVGLIALVVGISVNYQVYKRHVYWILGFSLLLMLLTVGGLGINRGHSTRWIGTGAFEFQPSELAKLAFVIYLAYSLEKKLARMEKFLIGWAPHLLVYLLFMGLCLAQPDLGTCIVMGAVLFAMLWVAGSKSSYVFGLSFVAIPLVAQYIALSSQRIARVITWLDPWSDRYGAGFQTVNSLTSLASGGISGLGLGMGRNKMGFLTQGWTDFIYASIGEELGLIGCCVVIALFGTLLWRGFRAAWKAPDKFGRFLAFGITVLICVQATFNMGVAVGLVPTKGLNLPLLSGGGSSMVMTLFAIGVLINVSRFAETPGAWRPLVAKGPRKSRRSPSGGDKPKRKRSTKKRKPITQRDSGVVPFARPSGRKGRS